MISMYFGVVVDIYPPTHKFNTFKHQYEYVVQVTGDDFCQFQVTAIRQDSSGNLDCFEDEILSIGDNVFIFFPRGDRSQGIITGGPRKFSKVQDPKLGKYYLKRFNTIETYIDKDGNWSVTSDKGPHAHVRTNNIELNDSVGEQILLDKDTKTITINTKEWVVNVKGNANIKIDGNANLQVGGSANVKVGGSLTADVSGKASVKAAALDANIKGEAKVKASNITLNGQAGKVLTTMTDPVVDYITGVPSQGVPNVKSGGG